MYIYSKRAKNRFLPFYPSVILGESFGYPWVRSTNRVLNEYRMSANGQQTGNGANARMPQTGYRGGYFCLKAPVR